MSDRPLIPASYAEPLRQMMADDMSFSLQICFRLPKAEADQRGREFVEAWERAGCPPLGDD